MFNTIAPVHSALCTVRVQDALCRVQSAEELLCDV
jgi:hypothetical protein